MRTANSSFFCGIISYELYDTPDGHHYVLDTHDPVNGLPVVLPWTTLGRYCTKHYIVRCSNSGQTHSDTQAWPWIKPVHSFSLKLLFLLVCVCVSVCCSTKQSSSVTCCSDCAVNKVRRRLSGEYSLLDEHG